MESNLLEIGNKIDMVRINNNLNMGKQDKHYVSQLLECDGTNIAKIAMPISNGVITPLEIGATYYLSFFTNNGVFACQAVILKRYKEKKIHLLEVKFISNLQKNQRRQYYRLDCLLDMEYRIETPEELGYLKKLRDNDFLSEEEMNQDVEKIKKMQGAWHHTTVTDISGGGLRCNSEYECKKDDIVWIKLRLHYSTSVKELKVSAVVIASKPLDNKHGFFENRVEFTNIRRADRETIIRFIFEEERRIRRREKGLD